MKLKRAFIENFKGVKGPLEIDFTSPVYAPGIGLVNEPRPLTCLIGDNGSGKTTILQAIALTLSLATKQIEDVTQFDWPGFAIERISSLGKTNVELTLTFSEDEIAATEELSRLYRTASVFSGRRDTNLFPRPGAFPEIDLSFDIQGTKVKQVKAIGQLRAREVARRFFKVQPDLMSPFLKRLGGVFWFGQDRNLGSFSRESKPPGSSSNGSIGASSGIDELRNYLIGMWTYHVFQGKQEDKDLIVPLEQRFSELFPGTKFIGVEPRGSFSDPAGNDFYFLFEREGKTYDLAEMSSGEQAVFPLIYDFVRRRIARSIILIDELELHLHPPEQQAMLGLLRRLGPDCQYIITTHSRTIETVIPDEHEVRLEGGRRCL